MFVFLYDRRSEEDSDMVLECSEPNECSIVIVVRNSVADAFFDTGCNGFDESSEL